MLGLSLLDPFQGDRGLSVTTLGQTQFVYAYTSGKFSVISPLMSSLKASIAFHILVKELIEVLWKAHSKSAQMIICVLVYC